MNEPGCPTQGHDTEQSNQRGKLAHNPYLQKPLTQKPQKQSLDIEINILGKLKRQDAYTNDHAQQHQICDFGHKWMKIRQFVAPLPDFFYLCLFWIKLGFPFQERPDHSRDISGGITTSSISIHAVNHMEGDCIIHPHSLN